MVNKSTAFAYFCYPYVNILNFALFLHKSQPLFFSKKLKKKIDRILLKTSKITFLLTVNKYFNQSPRVDCAIVEQKKKEFQYQDVFYVIT